MTFAWYAHLRNLRAKPLLVAVAASWGIAFFEYLLQVPANRIGSDVLNLSQLKIMQEVITLTVFVPFAILYMKQPIRLDFLWAGALPDGRGLLHLPRVGARGLRPTTSTTRGGDQPARSRRPAASQWRRSDAACAGVNGRKRRVAAA